MTTIRKLSTPPPVSAPPKRPGSTNRTSEGIFQRVQFDLAYKMRTETKELLSRKVTLPSYLPPTLSVKSRQRKLASAPNMSTTGSEGAGGQEGGGVKLPPPRGRKTTRRSKSQITKLPPPPPVPKGLMEKKFSKERTLSASAAVLGKSFVLNKDMGRAKSEIAISQRFVEAFSGSDLAAAEKLGAVGEGKRGKTPFLAAQDDGIVRTGWYTNVVKKHSEVLELRERTGAIARTAAFGKYFNAGKEEVRINLDKETIAKIVLLYLDRVGLTLTKKMLEAESMVKLTEKEMNTQSRSGNMLIGILREGCEGVDDIHNLVISDKQYTRKDSDIKIVDKLYTIGIDENIDEEDIDVWSEPKDSEDNILFLDDRADAKEQMEIKAASLNKLLERLTSEKSHDLKYMRTFLMTYRSFTRPEKLLEKLIRRYHVPVPKDKENDIEWQKSVRGTIQLRVVNVIKNWVEKHFTDFRPSLLKTLITFIDTRVVVDGNTALAKALKNAIQKAQGGGSDEREAIFTEEPPEPKIPKNIFSKKLTLSEIDEEEIARQITVMDSETYSSIRPTELLNLAWVKKGGHTSENVKKMIVAFNKYSGWVATSIITTPRLKQRAKIFIRFLKIARHLYQLNNFNSMMAILAGLNNSAVYRLKFTKEEVGSYMETHQELEKCVSSSQNYKGYRELLHQVNPPCIPYLGVYLTDLTFIEEGNQDTIGKLINFSKRKLIYNVIYEIQQYQQQPYNLLPINQIHQLLSEVYIISESELFKQSLEREPRDADRTSLQL